MNFKDFLIEKEIDKAFQIVSEDLKKIKIEESIIEITQDEKYKLNESLSVVLIIGLILGLPSLIKHIAKAFGFLIKTFKKLFNKDQNSPIFIEKIIKFTEKWHDIYINILWNILKFGGVFKSAGIDDKEKQLHATKVVFYTIIFGLAIYSGYGTTKGIINHVKNLHSSNISLTTLEGVLTSIKFKEVKTFINKIT